MFMRSCTCMPCLLSTVYVFPRACMPIRAHVRARGVYLHVATHILDNV